MDVDPSIGGELEASVARALGRLERSGLTAKQADEFIRDCVFNAWWDWDYQPAPDSVARSVSAFAGAVERPPAATGRSELVTQQSQEQQEQQRQEKERQEKERQQQGRSTPQQQPAQQQGQPQPQPDDVDD